MTLLKLGVNIEVYPYLINLDGNHHTKYFSLDLVQLVLGYIKMVINLYILKLTLDLLNSEAQMKQHKDLFCMGLFSMVKF